MKLNNSTLGEKKWAITRVLLKGRIRSSITRRAIRLAASEFKWKKVSFSSSSYPIHPGPSRGAPENWSGLIGRTSLARVSPFRIFCPLDELLFRSWAFESRERIIFNRCCCCHCCFFLFHLQLFFISVYLKYCPGSLRSFGTSAIYFLIKSPGVESEIKQF